MVYCFAPDCNHSSDKDNCKFFRFPNDEIEKKRWIKLIRRADRQPSKSSLICSCHFENGDKKNGPTVFLHNIKKQTIWLSPERKKMQKLAEIPSPILELPEIDLVQPSTSGLNLQPTAMTGIERIIPHHDSDDDSDDEESCKLPRLDLAIPNTSVRTSVVGESEIYLLKKQIETLSNKLSNAHIFSFSEITDNETRIFLYTGMSKEAFGVLTRTMELIPVRYYLKWTVKRFSVEDQLLITLMKLRQNLPHEDLACRFACSSATITNIVVTWLNAIHEIFFKQLMSKIPSRYKNKKCLPTCFNAFTNCRIILDCTEMQMATPKNIQKQRITYSSYKHKNTAKGLIGVAPNGVITFASKLYPGSLSDKRIVKHCGILQQLEAGDLILADKGFLINDILPPSVHLNIPPFLMTAQFSPEEVYETQNIARARIHVERAISRMKNFKILNFIPATLLPFSSIIFQTVASLTQFQYPLLDEISEKLGED